ncbi:MAG: GNAT family N-acetyltransferase [Planctomycetota bacterium]
MAKVATAVIFCNMNPSESIADEQIISVVRADLDNPVHAEAVVRLVNVYSRDVMGNGRSLPDDVLEEMVPALKRHPTTLVMLAFLGERAVGVAVCFVGLSTFAAKPLVNIHDIGVESDCRDRGVGGALIAGVEEAAIELGCCKLTLEVRQDNHRALHLYRKCGFSNEHLDSNEAAMEFWEKPLPRD